MNNSQYLNENDLDRLSIPTIDISEILEFREQILSIDDNEERKTVAFKYLDENYSELKTLKHWLNALHIKMFWEYFKDEINNLGIDSFMKLEGGKPEKMDIGELFIDTEIIKRKIKGKGICPFTYVKIYNNFIENIITKVLAEKIGNKYKDLLLFDNLEKLSLRIDFAMENIKEVIFHIYNEFIKENKDNEIVESYLSLEEIFDKKLLFSSDIKHIFPNKNTRNLNVFLANKIDNGETTIKIEEIKEFLERQNKQNIKRALSDDSGVSPDSTLANHFPAYKFDEEKKVVVYDNDAVDGGILLQALNLKEESRLEYNGGCPFAKMKSGTQQKNIFIEEFEFFDKLILELLKAVSERQGNNGEIIDFSGKI